MKIFNSLAFLFLIFGTTNVFAAQERGGGNAVVCRDLDHKIKTAEVLDLFEGRNEFGLNIPTSLVDAKLQAQYFILKLSRVHQTVFSDVFSSLNDDLQDVLKRIQFLSSNVGLPPIDDSFPEIVPKNCKIEQLAAYLSTGKLLIDSEIWAALNETNRAALYLHETIYKKMRDEFKVTESGRSRRIVAHLVSGLKFVPVFTDIDLRQHLYCYEKGNIGSKNFSFLVDLRSEPGVLSFVFIGGQPVVSQRRGSFFVEFLNNASNVVYPEHDTKSNFEGSDHIWFGRDDRGVTAYVSNVFGDSAKTVSYEFECAKPCSDENGNYIGYCRYPIAF